MFQQALAEAAHHIKGWNLDTAEHFIYLDSTLSNTTLKAKLTVNTAVVLPTIFYSSKTWTIYTRHTKQLDEFYMNWLTPAGNIESLTEVLGRASNASNNTILQVQRNYTKSASRTLALILLLGRLLPFTALPHLCQYIFSGMFRMHENFRTWTGPISILQTHQHRHLAHSDIQ